MEKLDLSILKKIPEPDLKVILIIEPLAPLSMVSDLPGSYYKTLKSPNKKMLCGLFENILGWHIDLADRKAIIKELAALRKKQAKKNPKLEFADRTQGSTYCPLLMDYFDVVIPVIPVLGFYDDLWSKAYRRADADVHPKGTFNLDYGIIPNKRKQSRDKDKPQKIDKAALFDFFKRNVDSYPLYYSTPTSREYIFAKGKFQIQLVIDSILYKMLCDRLSSENIGYLGNSEGWIDLKFEQL
ncbi:MAG TPA: type I-PGING CRISPR-associated protein Cas5p [Paludibacter sp.]|nr:type I-PGING CRISPR-associated protein Cas5p [Paludibacter sp.]